MNRRGFLTSCAAAVAAPYLPVSGLGGVDVSKANKWMIVDHLADPDAPVTSSISEWIDIKPIKPMQIPITSRL